MYINIQQRSIIPIDFRAPRGTELKWHARDAKEGSLGSGEKPSAFKNHDIENRFYRLRLNKIYQYNQNYSTI